MRPSDGPVGRPSLLGGAFRNWAGICGKAGIGAPLPKSGGSVGTFCEYLLLTKSAVLSALWGLSRGSTLLADPDRAESCEGRPDDCVAARPVGIGALICRGALMVGGPPLGRFSRFLRSEIPFPRSSDILIDEIVQSGGFGSW